MTALRSTKTLSALLSAGVLAASALFAGLAAPSAAEVEPPQAARASVSEPAILVFHRVAGFRHLSIADAVPAIEALGEKFNFAVDATDDPAAFTQENLAQYDAVVFVHTTGNVLPEPSQRAALEGYIRGSGGFLGIHAAADMGSVRTTWPWFRDLVGGSFRGHTASRHYSDVPLDRPTYAGPVSEAPPGAEPSALGPGVFVSTWEPAHLIVEEPQSPAMRGWGTGMVRADEWYGFRENPRDSAGVRVIASLDETSYAPAAGAMGGDHPIAWCQAYDGGRSVYTGMGHMKALWQEDAKFLKHILGSIQMAAGMNQGQFDQNCR
jgi:cytochrome c